MIFGASAGALSYAWVDLHALAFPTAIILSAIHAFPPRLVHSRHVEMPAFKVAAHAKFTGNPHWWSRSIMKSPTVLATMSIPVAGIG